MRKDIENELKVQASIGPADLGSGATVNGTSFDLRNSVNPFASALWVIGVGTWTDATHTFEIQESADDSSFSAVAATDLSGPEPVVDGAADDEQLYAVGYSGSKRYIRDSVTFASVTTGLADVASYIIAGNPQKEPVS